MRGILITMLVFLSANIMAQDFDAALNKANSKFFEENYNDALSEYQQLLESGLGDTIQQSWVLGYIGVCFQELGQIEEAKNNYREALKKGTPEASFYSKLLAIYKSEKMLMVRNLFIFPNERIYHTSMGKQQKVWLSST